jgi:hypothetical protein
MFNVQCYERLSYSYDVIRRRRVQYERSRHRNKLQLKGLTPFFAHPSHNTLRSHTLRDARTTTPEFYSAYVS